MTTALGIVAFLLLPLIGSAVWRLEGVRRMDLAGRLAVAGAAGALITAVVMAAMSLFGIRWSTTRLVVVLAVIAIAPLTRHFAARSGTLSPLRGARVAVWLFAILTIYGAVDARESCGDLHFFWGPKAVRFYRAGGIDADYLRDPNYYPAHPDYPPLVPLLYAWSNTLSRQFSWPAAVFSAVLFLLGSVAIVRATSGDDRGALLLAAALAYTFSIAYAAGGADPPLLFFETLAICALTFIEDERTREILAAIGLAGAVWTKIEGATFGIAVVIAVAVVQRRPKSALRIALPAAALFGSWLMFTRVNGLFDMYRGASYPIYWSALPKALRMSAEVAGYRVWGLPWFAAIALLAIGSVRRAAFPLAVAILTAGVAIYFYIHVPDPDWWIHASAPRVLLTPLLALMVAAISASTPVLESRPYGVVSQGEEA